jgi:predicted MFS family arabinose efflux permease
VAIPIMGVWLIAGFGWRTAVVACGVAAIVVSLVMLAFLRESGADRAAARAHGSVADAYRSIWRDRDIRWLYVTSLLSAGGRGLGVVNVFAPLYLSRVLGLDGGTVGAMYTVLLIGSVPGPLVAGWLSDRFGRRSTIIAVYVAGAIALAMFVSVGSNLAALWIATVLLSAFNFAESPQLQALLGDIAPPEIRDVSYATYNTLAFGVGSIWVLAYGVIIDLLGEAGGLPLVFWLMGLAFVAAAVAVLPIREPDLRAPGERADPVGGEE